MKIIGFSIGLCKGHSAIFSTPNKAIDAPGASAGRSEKVWGNTGMPVEILRTPMCAGSYLS